MARLFGEFLVRKKLVTTGQILEALMIQIRELPTYAEICYEKKLVSDENLLKILADQQRSGKDFKSAAEDAGVWTEGVAQDISRFLRALHKPVGEILIDLGYLTLETLTAALDEYVGEFTAVRSPAGTDPVKRSAFAPEHVEHFLATYREITVPGLQSILKRIESGSGSQTEILQCTERFISEISGVNGAAEFLGATALTGVTKKVLKIMEQVFTDKNYSHQAELRDIVRTASHVFEGCVQSVVEFGTDDVFSFDSNMADLRARLTKDLERLCSKLGISAEAA